jgi:hypothetical protein
MHDLVDTKFSEKRLISVRDAVRNRLKKPDENSIPFMDIASVIKFCNENVLIPEDEWNSTDNQRDAEKVRFSKQDRAWYQKILIASGDGEEVKEEQESAPSGRIKQIIEHIKLKITETDKDSDMLPLKHYREVKFMARGCDGAIAIIKLAASKNRPLTNKDADDILYQKSVCETKKLNDNM